MVGAFAFNVAVEEQIVCGEPALDVLGFASTLMATVLVEAGQVPFEIAHIKIFVPTVNPFTEAFGEFIGETVPVPETSDHAPVPTDGTFALNVALEEQIVCGEPAADAVGFASTLIATVLVEVGQDPLEIVHIKIFAPALSPLTVAFAELIGETDPVPETSDQDPVPTAGTLALKVVVEEQIV